MFGTYCVQVHLLLSVRIDLHSAEGCVLDEAEQYDRLKASVGLLNKCYKIRHRPVVNDVSVPPPVPLTLLSPLALLLSVPIPGGIFAMARPFALGKGLWDPSHRFETSWLLPPYVLFFFRAVFVSSNDECYALGASTFDQLVPSCHWER